MSQEIQPENCRDYLSDVKESGVTMFHWKMVIKLFRIKIKYFCKGHFGFAVSKVPVYITNVLHRCHDKIRSLTCLLRGIRK